MPPICNRKIAGASPVIGSKYGLIINYILYGIDRFRRGTEKYKCITAELTDNLIPVRKINANDNSYAMAA